jgi:FkbM family methyltransferase
MIETPPGIDAVAIAPLFAVSQYVIDDRSAEIVVEAEGLTVSSNANAWSYIIGYRRKSMPEHPSSVFAWAVRVHATLHSGSATFALVANDRTHVAAEGAVDRDRSYVDLAVEDLADAAWLIMRRGAGDSSDLTSVSLTGIESFALVEAATPPSTEPPTPVLRPVRGWARFYGSPDDGLASQIRYIQFRSLDRPRYMPWLEHLEVLIAPREQMSQAVYVSGLYEPCTAVVLRRLIREGDTFIDVGANVGWFSMLASRWIGTTGRIVSLEPSRRECDRLRHHVAHNDLTNVTVLQVAAGRDEGQAILHVADERYSGLNTLKPTFMYPDVLEAYVEQVPVVTVDNLIDREGIDRVHAIKIDVEGAEHDVLLGARRLLERHRPTLILEVAASAAVPPAIRNATEQLLRSFDYAFAGIDGERAVVTRVDDFTGSMENFVAAVPAVIGELTAVPITG